MVNYHLHYRTETPPELKKWDGFSISDNYFYYVERSRHGFIICLKREDFSPDDGLKQGLEDIARKYTTSILTGLSLFAWGGPDAAVTPSEKDTANFQRILQEVQRGSRNR